MSDPELTRKLAELRGMKLTSWNSVSSRIEELQQIKIRMEMMMEGEKYNHFKKIIKALSHSVRVNILYAIENGAMCPCELEYITGLAQATISHHLTLLEDAKLLQKDRKGKWAILKPIEKSFLEAILPF